MPPATSSTEPWTIDNSASNFKTDRQQAPIVAQDPGSPPSYKQSSITKGTLTWQHRRTGSNSRADAVSTDLRARVVAFSDLPRSNAQPPAAMTTLMNNDRAKSRRDRTFIGGQCAACEELLEHTLRGEKVLQFSCGHVAHEACFYEYIKDIDIQQCPTCDAPLGLDSERGGSMLDLGESIALNSVYPMY